MCIGFPGDVANDPMFTGVTAPWAVLSDPGDTALERVLLVPVLMRLLDSAGNTLRIGIAIDPLLTTFAAISGDNARAPGRALEIETDPAFREAAGGVSDCCSGLDCGALVGVTEMPDLAHSGRWPSPPFAHPGVHARATVQDMLPPFPELHQVVWRICSGATTLPHRASAKLAADKQRGLARAGGLLART
mmetsp:Transcript_30068/g.54843  ORF Transcript_30068/g.54843 Transcript_30068/m.54843 type:complete len:190 (-) Transcript_30068:972-1541(-)